VPSTVDYSVARGVATVTLARPEAMNALDRETKEALLARLEQARDDTAVRAVILTGAGRAFCVGQDLREHADALAADPSGRQALATVAEHYNPIVSTLVAMPKPTLAAVNGAAAGAGAGLAFGCDLRLMADGARFSMAFAGIGLSVDSGVSWTLPRLVGHSRAVAMLLLGEPVDAQQALAVGLVSAVLPAENLTAAATELATRLASGPTAAYAAIKQALAAAADSSLQEALATESRLQLQLGAGRDHQGAVRAFLAKQPPRFDGS
jgi:2-(1,2-epoxy-1,2-dihydrophenyl)acetyl-CoA isomerase